MGYIFAQHKERYEDCLIRSLKCKKQMGKSKRYLTRDQDGGCYDGTWKLIVPNDLQNMKNGVIMDADV